MKKVLLAGAFILGLSAFGFAQGRQQRTPEQQVENLKTTVTGITDAQSAKLMLVYQSAAKSRDSLMTALNGDMSGMREKMAPLTAATAAKLKGILTPEQYTAYEKQQAEARARRAQGGGGN